MKKIRSTSTQSSRPPSPAPKRESAPSGQPHEQLKKLRASSMLTPSEIERLKRKAARTSELGAEMFKDLAPKK